MITALNGFKCKYSPIFIIEIESEAINEFLLINTPFFIFIPFWFI